ncbi:hypothetical protein C8J57DRAFT_1337666, partial [Mycena rebaudengoi]
THSYWWKRGVRIASVLFVRCSPAAVSSRQTQPALVMGSRRTACQPAGRYGAEDGKGKRGGYGVMGRTAAEKDAGGGAHRVRGAWQDEVWSGGRRGRRG